MRGVGGGTRSRTIVFEAQYSITDCTQPSAWATLLMNHWALVSVPSDAISMITVGSFGGILGLDLSATAGSTILMVYIQRSWRTLANNIESAQDAQESTSACYDGGPDRNSDVSILQGQLQPSA